MPEKYTVPPPEHHPETENPDEKPLVDDKKKSVLHKKSSIFRHHPHAKPCEQCGHVNSQPYVYPVEIYPPPRPADRIRPDNKNFVGYVVLLAILIFLFYCAVKYLP